MQDNVQIQCSPYKNSSDHFCTTGKANHQIHVKLHWAQIAKTVLKMNRIGGLIVPHFKTYCKATVIKTDTGIRVNRDIWDRTEGLVYWFLTECQVVLEQLNNHMQKNTLEPLPQTMLKN